MSKTLLFIKLDYITVKKYLSWKTLLIFLAICAFFGYTNGYALPMIMGPMFGVLFSSYTFSITDNCGLDTLYATLPITKKNIVLGRYTFTFCINLFMLLISTLLTYAITNVLKIEFNISFIITIAGVCFFVFSLLEAIQLPIFFKLGYTKAKLLTYLPLMLFTPGCFVLVSVIGEGNVIPFLNNCIEWIGNNPLLFLILILIVWLIMETISYLISYSFYKKREF